MARNSLILIMLLFLIAVAGWAMDSGGPLSAARDEPSARAPSARTAAPDFTFTDMRGRTHNLSDFAEKPVLLNFWASWCAPCIVEFPLMLELAQKLGDEAVFIFLSQDEEIKDIEDFVSRYSDAATLENIYIAHDPEGTIARDLYQSFKLPETYILSPGHTLAEKIVGADYPWASDETAQKIRALGTQR